MSEKIASRRQGFNCSQSCRSVAPAAAPRYYEHGPLLGSLSVAIILGSIEDDHPARGYPAVHERTPSKVSLDRSANSTTHSGICQECLKFLNSHPFIASDRVIERVWSRSIQ
jgi:hypothetical protein